MGTLVPFERPADYARVHRRIKRLWEEGFFEIHGHAQKAMRKRKLDVLDVQNVILHGSIISHDRQGEQWRYRIQGAAVSGVTASCVVAVEGRALIVSVLDY